MKKVFLLGLLALSLTACDRNRSEGRGHENHTHVVSANSQDQGETEADRQVSQRIRRAILADQALSPHAKNITIITAKGIVTLRGSVLTPKERDAILRKVHELGGIERVENQLEISPQR